MLSWLQVEQDHMLEGLGQPDNVISGTFFTYSRDVNNR